MKAKSVSLSLIQFITLSALQHLPPNRPSQSIVPNAGRYADNNAAPFHVQHDPYATSYNACSCNCHTRASSKPASQPLQRRDSFRREEPTRTPRKYSRTQSAPRAQDGPRSPSPQRARRPSMRKCRRELYMAMDLVELLENGKR